MASECVTMPRSKLQDCWVSDHLYLEAPNQETLNQFWFQGQQLTDTYCGSEIVLMELMRESGLTFDGVVNKTYDQRFRYATEEFLRLQKQPYSTREYISDPEHLAAYDGWIKEGDHDLPCNYRYYDQAWDCTPLMGRGTDLVEYTPEMLDQLDQLNWYFNFVWNPEQGVGGEEEMVVPDLNVDLQLVKVGANHGVAKCQFGGVFVPKSVLKYLGEYAKEGICFEASVTFVNQRFPWRIVQNSVVPESIRF